MKKDFSLSGHQDRHGGNQVQPRRVASRMEGAVKNRGTRAVKKQPKG